MSQAPKQPDPTADTADPKAQPERPDITKTLSVIAGGSLIEFLSTALGEAARGVTNTDSRIKGKVSLELTLEPAKGGMQLLVSHKAAYKRPTPTGDIAETITGETALYANARGALSLVPDNQQRLF